MGGVCSKSFLAGGSLWGSSTRADDLTTQRSVVFVPPGDNLMVPPIIMTGMEPGKAEQSFRASEGLVPALGNAVTHGGERRDLQYEKAAKLKSGASKVSEVSSIIGWAGFGKAVEVLDALGSSMTNLNPSSGFVCGTKGDKITILAFEVANTIVKGSNLMQSLSEEGMKHLRVALFSEGVQRLISRDMNELLMIAASDKRNEMKVFEGEIVRFGNRCKDPQWHNLDRYFEKLDSEVNMSKKLKEVVATTIEQLMLLVQHTAELYHELNVLDRLEQDYKRKLHEDGDGLQTLLQELKGQKKHVDFLKKCSLWSRNLEEVMEKLVDFVYFLHLEMHEAFENDTSFEPAKKSEDVSFNQRLGPAGLSLHYANIISQIDNLVSRSGFVPSNTRDVLYHGLPICIKDALRTRLQLYEIGEDATVPFIKEGMEKTLVWLRPIADNTTKAHHGFGWVGEWANTGTEMNRKQNGQMDLLRIETLHYADKSKTEECILDLILQLHHLISRSKPSNGYLKSLKSPVHSPPRKVSPTSSSGSSILTNEDREMLRTVMARRLTPGISRSQELGRVLSWSCRESRLSKSSSHTPCRGSEKEVVSTHRLPITPHAVYFDPNWDRTLDMIDRVDTLRSISEG